MQIGRIYFYNYKFSIRRQLVDWIQWNESPKLIYHTRDVHRITVPSLSHRHLASTATLSTGREKNHKSKNEHILRKGGTPILRTNSDGQIRMDGVLFGWGYSYSLGWDGTDTDGINNILVEDGGGDQQDTGRPFHLRGEKLWGKILHIRQKIIGHLN